MSKALFIICILLSLQSNAQGVDPNLSRSSNPMALEAGVPQIPCEECGDLLVESNPAPQVKQLNLDIKTILATPGLMPKGAKSLIDEQEPRASNRVLKPASSGNEFRNIFNFDAGQNATIEIRGRKVKYNKRW